MFGDIPSTYSDTTIVFCTTTTKKQEFAGKRVLVVGSGESGSDICNEISKYASATALAIRGKHGHLIPRKQADGRVTDLNTNRCRYSNPSVLGDWVGYVNQLVSQFFSLMGLCRRTRVELNAFGHG